MRLSGHRPSGASHTSATNMTPFTSTDAHMLLADVLQTLSDSTIRLNLGPRAAYSSATGQVASKPQPPVRRAALLAQDAAEDCAEAMFLRSAGGPHPSGSLPVADYPTIEEIAIGQAAVAVKIGEKGSEERARASQLAALGTIAKEEALGFWLCDRFLNRFRGAVPSSQRAHAIAKAATDRLPLKKEKGRWKEQARQARKAAEKQGANGDEVAAAGQRAAAAARAAFEQVEVDLGMERPPAGPPAPEPPSVSPNDAADDPAPEPTSDAESDAGPTAIELLEMAQSKAGWTAITCAYRVVALRRQQLFPDSWPTYQLDMAQLKYRHALRRVNQEYPGLLPSRRAGHEFSAQNMVKWTVALEAAGHSNPVAVVAARKVGFDLAGAAENCRRAGEVSIWPVECPA